ncbi:MAG: head GIN domain-containing protein [Rhodothalassiaceae bacterium]
MRLGPFHAGVFAIAMLAGSTALAAPVSQSREVPDFRKIEINGGMDATVRVGKPKAVTIHADADDQERIRTEVRGNTLVIKMKGNFRSTRGIRAEISVPALDGFAINGSTDATLSGVDAKRVDLGINGSGDIEISGTGGECDFEINGSGDLMARNFRCKDVVVEISGSGDAEIFASGALEVAVSGSGDVDAWGGPKVKSVSISGSGDFTAHH